MPILLFGSAGRAKMRAMRIGIDLGGTKIEAVALADGGSECWRRRVPTPRDDYDGTLRAITELVRSCELDLEMSGTVGVATPGAVSPATGRMKNANSTWLNDRPLREDLERMLVREIRTANDANCFALSEAMDGSAQGARVVFGVILGTGVGGGLVIDQACLQGPNAIAGEWGHNPLPWPTDDERPGERCYCGRNGCIETFLSGPGMSRDHERATGRTLRGEEIVARAADGETEAMQTLDRYAERLSRALASVVNLLDPDVIVLGGGLSNLDRLYTQVPALWGRWVFSDRVDTRLVPPLYGDASGVRGAACLWPR